MPAPQPLRSYRFGVFEADPATGELRRKGMRIKLHLQPFQLLILLLDRPGQMLTREEICRELWPEGTFVDYEHGVNSALNRLREALGDKAANPTFIETIARRGYRFLVPVERLPNTGLVQDAQKEALAEIVPASPLAEIAETPVPSESAQTHFLNKFLASPEDLPSTPHKVVQRLFLLLQLMYIAFYIGALANLTEITELFAALAKPALAFNTLIATAALLIPARTFILCAVLFHAPRFRQQFLSLWPLLFVLDILWSLAPFLLLHHIPFGLALACMTFLVYSPFAQRSLILMGAASNDAPVAVLR